MSTQESGGASTDEHELVGERLRVTYRPVDQDLPDGSMSFGEPENIELDVSRVNSGRAVGEADDGRMVSTPLTRCGRRDVRCRAADRDEGAFRTKLGSMRNVDVVSEG